MSAPTPIQTIPVVALNDYTLPFQNWSYNGTLIDSSGWSVFFWLYSLPNVIAANQGQSLVYGPVAVTITSAGTGTPLLPAQYLTPQTLFLARTQAFQSPNLLTPPTDGSEKITSDIYPQTGG